MQGSGVKNASMAAKKQHCQHFWVCAGICAASEQR
jgi:hypothetical protein